MAKIPLILKLKKQMYKDIARAQDIVIKEIYSSFERPIFHGGTAIWRCYGGNRVSEDIDVFLPKDAKKINAVFESLEKNGFVIKKKKISENSLYSNLELNRVAVRFEALFKKPLPKGVLKEYETADGNLITVYTLAPEDFVKERVETYLKTLKIRDLYDIFFLLRHVREKREVSMELEKLVKNFKKPVDEKELKVLLIEGIVPSSEEMIDYTRRV